MQAFLEGYREAAALNDTYELDPEIVLDIAAEDRRFSLPFLPIVKGGVRFLSSSIASSPHCSGLRLLYHHSC